VVHAQREPDCEIIDAQSEAGDKQPAGSVRSVLVAGLVLLTAGAADGVREAVKASGD
jgi:hypothetical protein